MDILKGRKDLYVVVLLLTLAAPPAVRGAGCNADPVAVDDDASAYSDPIVVDVLANDDDPDGEALTVTVTGGTCQGTTTVEQGLVSFAPNPPLTADCTITYEARDESGNVATATLRVGRLQTAIFADGFEAGNASAWSECAPSCP